MVQFPTRRIISSADEPPGWTNPPAGTIPAWYPGTNPRHDSGASFPKESHSASRRATQNRTSAPTRSGGIPRRQTTGLSSGLLWMKIPRVKRVGPPRLLSSLGCVRNSMSRRPNANLPGEIEEPWWAGCLLLAMFW